MIWKLREVKAKQLADLHAVAWREENQFIFDPPKDDRSDIPGIDGPFLEPALRIKESKEACEGFHEMLHDVTLEFAELHWRPPTQEEKSKAVIGQKFCGYIQEPIPRRLVSEVLDAVGRFTAA